MHDAPITHHTVTVDGIDIFYRQAGNPAAPTLLLLHGFPTSSRQFTRLMRLLSADYHLIAPDYPGFGYSADPGDLSGYTFDYIAKAITRLVDHIGLTRFALYMFDYGSPIGMRLASANPHRVAGLIFQNGNTYASGLGPLIRRFFDTVKADDGCRGMRRVLSLTGIRGQYIDGVPNANRLDPDAWTIDHHLANRPGRIELMLALARDYPSNIDSYPVHQQWLRKWQPPTLVVWGKNDSVFVEAGAHAFRHDLPQAHIRTFDTGHFALETHVTEIAELISDFHRPLTLTA